jgi:hypothetical protein
MSIINNVDWRAILEFEAGHAEKLCNINVEIDEAIVFEVERRACDSLDSIGLIQPNAAKIAGLIAFWVRTLKPLRIASNSPNNLLTLNEFVALSIGLAICNAYKDDDSKAQDVKLPPRILNDWIKNFRYHSHSPSSTIISFELLTCDA